MMNRTILSGILILSSTLSLSAQVQPLRLDSSFGIKPLSMGAEDWIVEVQPSPEGGFYVAQEELGLTKLDAGGNKLWSKPYPVVDSWAVGTYGIAVDGESNVYLGRNDYLNRASQILKYNSTGDVVNSFTATGVCSFVDDVTFNDNLKALYAVFNCPGSWLQNSILIKKFDANLTLLKSITYNSPSVSYTWGAGGIALDEAGYVYVAGASHVSTYKVIGLKFNPDLNLTWEYGELSTSHGGFSVSNEAVPEGGMYLGFLWKDISSRLLNISDAGIKRWQKAVSEDYHDYKTVDKDGNFYGATWVEENDWSPTVSKLGYGTGDIEWELAEKHSAMIADIYVDSQTRVYTVGELLEPQGDANYYIARYIHGEVPKNYITKSAPPEPHLVNTGAYSVPLVSLVRDADGNPTVNVDLLFNISRSPDFAVGQQLSKNSERTNSQGLADVLLKLGNIPAEYGVTATCASCEPSANSVTFTCCGKLPNDHYSQSGVPAWSPTCYANNNCQSDPNATIGWRGCALTSLATLINYYSDNVYSGIPRTNPGTLNTYLRGLPVPQGYNERNDVNFDAIERYSNGRASYAGRYDVGDYDRVGLLDTADGLIRSGIPLIFRVRGHFLLVIGKCGDSYIVADPAGGSERLYNPDDLSNQEFEGLRIFGAW